MAWRGSGGEIMAKRKTEKPKSPKPKHAQVRMSEPFHDWLLRYAEFRGVSVADVITLALIRDAKAEGFGEAPPKR